MVSSELVQNNFTITGPLGLLSYTFKGSDIVQRNKKTFFFFTKGSCASFLNLFLKHRAYLASGLFLEISLVGLGFRILKLHQILLLKVGHAHYIKLPVPRVIHLIAYKKRVLIFGITLDSVNQFAARLVAFRKPDIYKNKGIQIVGKAFRLKVGKQK